MSSPRSSAVLPVQPVARQQLLGALALGADVGSSVRREIRQLDEDALRLVEVFADHDEQDAVALRWLVLRRVDAG